MVLEVGLSIAQLVFSWDRPRASPPGLEKEEDEEEAQGPTPEGAQSPADEWWAEHLARKRYKGGRYAGQVKPALSRLDRDPDLVWVAPMAIRYVVGVVGERFAGKTTVVNFLVSRCHCRLYRLSQFVYEEARRRGVDIANRDNVRRVGDELREEYGVDAIARMAFARIRADHLDADRRRLPTGIVIEGFRVPEELAAWQRLGLFRTLLVSARPEERLARASASGNLAVDDLAPAEERATRLEWLRRHVDEPEGRKPARPLVDQAKGHLSSIELENNDSGWSSLFAELGTRVMPELERWWRGREI